MLGTLKAKKIWWFTVAVVLLLFSAHANAADKITLQLRWLHQFQFAGYYAAKAKGFYRDAGFDVTIVAGAPGREAISEVLADRAQYAIANHELLLNKLRGKPLVALAAIFQHSPAVFLVRQDSGIRSPQDLVGRRVMTIGGKAGIGMISMLRSEGVNPEQVKFIKSSFDINDLVNGNTDAFNSYLTNEPYFMKKIGVPVTVINPATYGIDLYSDILFTSEDEVRNHPNRVKRFRKASLRGWEYAMQNQEEIIDLIRSKYKSTKTRDHLRFEANAMDSLILPNLIEIGHMNPGRWKHMADTFVKEGLADPGYSLEGFIYDPDPPPDLRKWYLLVAGLVVTLLIVAGIVVIVVYFNGKLKREIGEREQAEQALSDAKEQAELANRSKSEFLAHMSHELRTPLNSVIGFADMLEKEIFGSLGHAKYQEYAKDIHASGTHLLSLISDILDISKIEAGELDFTEVSVDVGDIIVASTRMVTDRAEGGGITLSLEVSQGLPRLRGDALRLKQILLNLLSNAIKFTPKGGQVTIEAKVDGSNAMVWKVIDTGVGIDTTDLSRVLKPFEQVREDVALAHEGTGLGLYLTNALTELHGGTLEIESEVGKGTTVTVKFPPERTN